MLMNLSPLLFFMLFLLFSLLMKKKMKKTMKMLGGASLLSLVTVSYWFVSEFPSMILNMNWLNSSLTEMSISFIMDHSFMMFSCVALLVTWSMMEFSHYYMKEDPKKQKFLKTLILFLLFMLMLTSAKSLFLLFIGWEGVGILSFILMGWWFTRTEANSAALQAIMYKRMGDSGLLIFLSSTIILYSTWNLKEMMFFKINYTLKKMACLGIMIAAAGKSAQFSLHPWLPSAMEGPTPVSALLHSSTMVVAGVFLLFRTSKILSNKSWSLKLIAMLGSMTAMFAASSALFQFDMKKMVAYSTTSQLGLMVVAMGLKIPHLAFFHICTHAFFKALLFLCSGSMIHNLKKEQDLRKMSKISLTLPFTSSCITMSSLALCGMPFLAGYYSKDTILEICQTSLSKKASIILSMVATLMTVIYSLRMMYYMALVNTNKSPMKPIKEENFNLYKPFLRLIMGMFLSGWVGTLYLFKMTPIMIPLLYKSLPFIFLMYGSMYMLKSNYPSIKNLLVPQKTSLFLGKNWFFVKITHQNNFFLFFKSSLKGVLRTLDQGWVTKVGASGMTNYLTTKTKTMQKLMTGIIPHYMLYLTALTLLIFLSLS